ncbi:pyridoxamine 5'-phosphate oxidase [Kushneria sinocarnis]|uniref:Pyridoxamine 5'-phosphate oxidase n=1 Tax=Kushneria sinocarnis TaxID=595502 RepID=A0A420WW99_9GAMM|nr:pyridoxamine 5'-phosphate oxidase family protein [Kushneria sinocarnis]RKR03372.1 pyridoxamine 5'-phosphate oxidase [Kushneria sinocarnis]
MENQASGARCVELLNTCLYANIATIGGEQPWNTPATAIADSSLNIYWSSWTEAVHSKNILANPRVFITYYDSTRERGTNNRRCLYLRCEAAVVSDRHEACAAHELLYPDEEVQLDDFLDSGLRRFYRATPLQAWLNCLSEQQVQPNTIDMRVEVPLEEIRGAL